MTSGFINAVPYIELLSHWGFDSAVFDADEARKEKRLESVMEYPSWFFEILGNINDLDFITVTGARGTGKSALRRSIVEHCRTNIGNDILSGTVLCINIDHDCPEWIKKVSNQKSAIECFCEEVIESLVIAVLTFIDNEKLKNTLLREEVYLLERYIFILKEKRPDEINVMAEKILSTYKKIRNNDNITDWIKIVSGLLGREIDINGENKTPNIDAINDIQKVVNILTKNGFDAIYVLVDEIDEYNETNGRPQYAAEIMTQILSSINLLEKEHIGFKFFLSAPVFHELDKACKKQNIEIRYDRTLHPEPYVLNWSDEDIKKILKKRLMTYSDNRINSLQSFCCDDLPNIDDAIVRYSYKNPRHLIQLCNRLGKYVARTANIVDFKITKEIFDNAILDYSKLICKSIYTERYLQAMIDFGQLEISDEKFANQNEIDLNMARSVLDDLVNMSALSSKINLKGSKTYSVTDPRIAFLINIKVQL